MKTKLDAKVSKRPIPIPEEADLAELEKTREQLEKYITSLKRLDSDIDSPQGQALIFACYARLRQIERRRMFIDVTDVTAHAAIVGQWNECLRITLGQIGDDEKFLLTGETESVKSMIIRTSKMLLGVLSKKTDMEKAISQNEKEE